MMENHNKKYKHLGKRWWRQQEGMKHKLAELREELDEKDKITKEINIKLKGHEEEYILQKIK